MPATYQKDNPLYAVNLACGLAADFNQCPAKCEICCEKPQHFCNRRSPISSTCGGGVENPTLLLLLVWNLHCKSTAARPNLRNRALTDFYSTMEQSKAGCARCQFKVQCEKEKVPARLTIPQYKRIGIPGHKPPSDCTRHHKGTFVI